MAEVPSDEYTVVDVMGLPLWALDRPGLIELLVDRAANGVRTRVCYLNAHSWHVTRRDPTFRELLATVDVLYADGMSIVWASRVLGSPLPERLSSADYVEEFARACAAKGTSVFLLGGADGVAERAAESLTTTVPDLRVAGTCSGYFDPSDCRHVLDRINQAQPDLLLVGMGTPRQEQWSAQYQDELSVPVIWSVGALFDYLAGEEKRAPQWMCRHGLEWAYRLAMNPLGKARRYLLENPLFVGSVLTALLRQTLRSAASRSAEE